MKKVLFKSLLITLALGMLTGCVLYNGRNKDGSPKGGSSSQPPSSEPSSSSNPDSSSSEPTPLPPPPEGDVNLYLVLGPNGQYDTHPGDEFPALFLENTKAITVAIGSDLPGASLITSTVSGSTFSHWINRETTETVTKAPAEESVLVAVFKGGDGSNQPKPGEMPNDGYGFMFYDKVDDKDYYKVGQDAGEETISEITYHQYRIADFTLIKDQKFQLYDFGSGAGWTVTLDPYSCGAKGNASKLAEYLDVVGDWYVVKKTFTTDGVYIKLAYEHDQLYIGRVLGPDEVTEDGYGLKMYDENGENGYTIKGEDQGMVDVYGKEYHQYKIAPFELKAGRKFRLYNFENGNEWTVALDTYSFGAGGDSSKVDEYVTITGGYYVIHKAYTMDENGGVFIKLRYEEDQVYIG